MKKILILLLIAISFGSIHATVYAEDDISNYTTLRQIDKETFNEYRYRITEQFFLLRDRFEVEGTIDSKSIKSIADIAGRSYKYLPDNLKNKNYLQALATELNKSLKFPDNEANYTSLVQALSNYLEKVDIQSLKGSVQAIPLRGNAPLTVTLRGKINDPTGASIPNFNYVWWMNTGGTRVEIGRGQSLTYTFREEGNFSVFLDVTSSHKNEAGFTDVLPFSSRADIQVEEKIASLLIKVNGINLRNKSIIKFTPAEARYGLIFDATSSTPTSGTAFLNTEWDFGNGDEREYDGLPRVERVKYAAEGDYNVKLKLKTNDLHVIERKFIVSIHDPIATIDASQEEGFIGDKFTFKAKPGIDEDDLGFSWEIIDVDNDEIIYNKAGKNFNYTFVNKGRFNVKLTVTEPSGDVDIDTQIIYINSRAPVAAFTSKIPQTSKPNTVFLDASKSYDPDFTDDGRLKYNWYINGNKVNLDRANSQGSSGYYTFDSVGSHSVNLEVVDLDNISTLKKNEISIKSILAVETFAFPRVVQRENFIKFVAESPEAEIFEWDFGDGTKKGGASDTITHTYSKSGTFDAKLKVIDKDGNTNTYTKTVYVGDSEKPVAITDVAMNSQERPEFDANACNGKGAYVIDRTSNMKFDGKESINTDGTNKNISYSWRVGNSKFSTGINVSHKFDELGCFPVKLTVKNNEDSKTDTDLLWMDVRNSEPILTSLNIDLTNPDGDPLVVNVSALGAEDPDGVIQSYLWYYYTDIDSEPQEFRSTIKPSTTFVLPKITGNYYFVSILKDNNEAKVNSEEITGSKFFITVTGDNIDTPLVDLGVNDSALSIAEEVVYTATAKNILGQDLSKKVKYSWDFDGDGFYDKETSTPTVTHKFDTSGTFHSKVKVKHKGISSTKTVTLNVSNVLTPDFDYISIGNKVIFFDTSKGQVETLAWDLGDNTIKDDSSFVHTYVDNKPTHKVKLKISEGTKTKEITKTVVRDLKNIIKSRRDDLNVFTHPSASEDGTIILSEKGQEVFIYSGDSNAEVESYGIDFDVEIDSDLNGGKDDDEDNKGTASYLDGSIASVELNARRTQSIRVFIKDAEGKVIDSQDIEILKEYIEEEVEIDPSTIEFTGISEIEREKIDTLKTLLSGLDQTQRIESMSYVQKLQEEWFDDTEKTRIIIDFETYLDENTPDIADEAIELLESLLVEGQEDKSSRNISFNALKNLVPQDITCEQPEGFESCYDYLIGRLESIKDSESLEDSKTLGSEVLSILGGVENMTNAQKLDFKAILKALVYGSVDNIPEGEREDIANDGSENEKESSKLISILSGILYWLGVFIGVFLLVAILYFIYYKIANKDDSVGFTDFIKNKTAADDETDILSDLGGIIDDDKAANDNSDVLSSMPEEKESVSKIEDTQESASGNNADGVPDWLAGNFDEEPVEKKQDKKPEPVVEMPKKEKAKKQETEEAPSWLTGVDDKQKDLPKVDASETKIETPKKKEEVKIEDDLKSSENTSDKKDEAEVPSWLAGASDDKKDNKKPAAKKSVEKPKVESKIEAPKVEDKETPAKVEKKKKEAPKKKAPTLPDENLITDENIDAVTSLDEAEVPSWLKQDFSKVEGVEKKKESKAKLKVDAPKADTSESADEKSDSKSNDPHLPDWLADSFVEETPKAEAPKVEDKKAPAKVEEKKKETPKKKETKKPAAKKPATKPKTESKTDDTKTSDKKDGSELWDDGMEVPDWLKS